MEMQSERIRAIREALHLNQSQLARRIGVTSQLVSLMENDKSQMSNLVAKAISTEFGISIDWILKGEGPMYSPTSNHPTSLPQPLEAALCSYPTVAKLLNEIAYKMNLADWEALESFAARQVGKQENIDDWYEEPT